MNYYGKPLRYSCLENSMDGGAWWATVHGVTESDMTEQLHFTMSSEKISGELKCHGLTRMSFISGGWLMSKHPLGCLEGWSVMC